MTATAGKPARRGVDAILYLFLKLTNVGLAVVGTIGLMATLIRVVGLESYAEYALVVAIGGYVIASDLGMSRILYGRMRTAHLSNDAAQAREAFGTFFSVSTSAFAVLAIAFFALIYGAHLFSDAHRGNISLLFLLVVSNLPSMMMRSALTSVDKYLYYETAEAIRRGLIVVLLVAVLNGLPFILYLIINLLAWIPWYVFLLVILSRQIDLSPRDIYHPGALRRLKHELRSVIDSAVFWITDFSVYNLPYFAIPLIDPDPLRIVVFDAFYKVTRFGQMAFQVAADVVLPQQTRAAHAGDGKKIRKGLLVYALLSSVAVVAVFVLVAVFGDVAFKALLGRADIVTPGYRTLMLAMILAMAVQYSALTFLMAIDRFMALRRISTLALVGCLIAVGLTKVFGLGDVALVVMIVAVYAAGALAYGIMMWRFSGDHVRPHAEDAR